MLTSITDIKHVFYINLEERKDRKKLVEKELSKIGIVDANRFNAVKLSPIIDNPGALGCSLSHLKCVLKAKENNWDHVLICEDDIEFLNPELFKKQLNTFLAISKNKWDVVLLAGNNMLPYIPISNCCIQVMNCITTTGYIVLNHYYDTLIQNYKDGIAKLMKNTEKNNASLYKIDKYWLRLQRKDHWYLIIPLSIIQRKNYSNIENSVVDFSNYMLDYNKTQT